MVRQRKYNIHTSKGTNIYANDQSQIGLEELACVFTVPVHTHSIKHKTTEKRYFQQSRISLSVCGKERFDVLSPLLNVS